MKFLEKIIGEVKVNKFKIFIQNNKVISVITKGYKKIFNEGKDYEKVSLFVVPILNIFLFYGIISFVVVIVIDYLYYKFLEDASK